MPRALVVDDNEDIAELLAMLFSRAGYDVETASSAIEAIDKCAIDGFDLILSDVGMPVMNGFELARRLRAGGCGDTIIIAVTGFDIYDDRKRAISAGFDEIINKPVSAQTLLATIALLRKTKK